MKREQETFPYIAHLLNGAEVEWKPLGEVAKVNKGVQLNKTKLKDEGKYPAYNGGKTYSGWTDDFNVEENTTIISQGGASAGFVNFVTTKFWANAHCYYIIPNLEIVNNRYLYQFLKFQEKFFMNSQHGAGIPALAISKLNKHLIPVPPLSVQQEIVRILDKFTQLEAELEAELDCRKRQYEYYRDMLLSFNEVVGAKILIFSDLQWKTLGEVAELKRGRVISKEYLYENIGEYPVYSSQTVNNGEIGKIKTFDFEQEAITWTTDGANAGTVFYREGRFSITNVCGLITIKNIQILNYKYLYYWLSIEAKKHVYSGMGHPKLMSNQMEKIQIPIPPIEEQERIAGILDKFDTLVNSISEGLPREIELRRKQYEYYREKLLSFPKN
jgi:restriction modification system DNA specificity domain protein